MKTTWLLSLFVASAAFFYGNAMASTSQEVSTICPIGGEKFKRTVVMSGTQFGMGLDLKPFGPIIAPYPLPKCPKNGFVLFQDNFSKDELAALSAYIQTPDYQAAHKVESAHFLAAMLMRHLKMPELKIAQTMLSATWEAEKDARYERYASVALNAFEAVIAKPLGELANTEIALYGQLAGEMERRLGRFVVAEKRFKALLLAPSVAGSTLQKVIEQELRLVKAKDKNAQLFSN